MGRKKVVTDNINAISGRANAVLNIFFILISILCIAPLVLVIVASFTDEDLIQTVGYSFWPSKTSIFAYHYIFSGATNIIRAYGITILVTVVGTAASIMITALFAYPLSRKNLRYRKQIAFIVFLTMIFNAGYVPWYIVYSQILHLKDSLWVYIIPGLINAWYVIILRTFFSSSIPDAIIESAKIDGAGELRIFFSIVLRLSLPGLATIGLFTSIGYWNDWWTPLVFITKPELYNLQYTMYVMLNNAQYIAANIGKMTGTVKFTVPIETARMAMCIVAIGPIVLAYPFFQNYFIKGLTIGAVKG